MSFFLEIVGPAVWRASWQASLLAGAVGLLLWFLDDRATPRWRYLLWSVVLVRFLLPITPTAPWSAFNFSLSFYRDETVQEPRIAPQPAIPNIISEPRFETAPTEKAGNPRDIKAETIIPPASLHDNKTDNTHSISHPRDNPSGTIPSRSETVSASGTSTFTWQSSLIVAWLAGALIFASRLIHSAFVLRRRLSRCQPVTNEDLLNLLQDASARIGVRRAPDLIVSPEAVSPCLVGPWRPRIVLPESSLTDLSPDQLQGILAHELGHLKRGDLWTNWLLLAARTLHWFNPIAWWTVRRLQEERESACDEIALSQLPQAERNHYANTILDLAASLSPNPLVPGMIGFFAPKQSLARRIRRLARTPRVRPLRPSIMLALCVILAAAGLTDAGSPPGVEQKSTTSSEDKHVKDDSVEINRRSQSGIPAEFRGDAAFHARVVDRRNGEPLANARIELFAVQGMTEKLEKVATTTSNKQGEFDFDSLKHPFQYLGPDRLHYWYVATAQGRPLNVHTAPITLQGRLMIPLSREAGTLTGRVVNELGTPVAGARVAVEASVFDTFNIPEFITVSDADGRFTIDDLPVIHPEAILQSRLAIIIQHPDYARSRVEVEDMPADITIMLNKGSFLKGVAVDKTTGEPSPDTRVIAVNVENGRSYHAITNVSGEYGIHVPQGNYDILAYRTDRVAVAIKDRECPDGETIQLPDFQMIAGGMISGRLVDGKTGEPVPFAKSGHLNAVDLKGPSRPMRVIGRNIVGIVKVDEQGRFRLRAVPGENYPFVLTDGRADRVGWNINEQEPVIVKNGQDTEVVIHITHEKTDDQKMAAAERMLENLPEDQTERVEAILAEFRKLKDTTDHEETWCLLMRELVSIGPPAVPQINQELDQATADRHLRRLAFTLRAIGDPRAVPALIRAIPRALVPSSSDYGMIVADPELLKFMQKHDLSDRSGEHFSFQRPPREVLGALRKLAGRDVTDRWVRSIMRGDDPRRNAMAQKIYNAEATRWSEWWNANSRDFVDDPAYQTVNLELEESPIPPAKALSADSKAGDGGVIGMVLSPASESGKYVDYFMDLDTGLTPLWPDDIPQDKDAFKSAQLAQWSAKAGADLMCVTTPDAEGNPVYALYGFDLQAWEITHADVQNLQKRIEAGILREGIRTGNFLIHFDLTTGQSQPGKNAAFFYVTREGNMGVIEITDHITIVKDLTGQIAAYSSTPTGVGFHKGVKFNHTIISP